MTGSRSTPLARPGPTLGVAAALWAGGLGLGCSEDTIELDLTDVGASTDLSVSDLGPGEDLGPTHDLGPPTPILLPRAPPGPSGSNDGELGQLAYLGEDYPRILVGETYVWFGTRLGLYRVPKTGGEVEGIAAGDLVRNLSFHQGYVHFTEYWSGRQARAPISGGPAELLREGVPRPGGQVIVDGAAITAQYTNRGRIVRLPLNATSSERLSPQYDHPGRLRRFGDHLYWATNVRSARSANPTHRMPLAGGPIEPLFEVPGGLIDWVARGPDLYIGAYFVRSGIYRAPLHGGREPELLHPTPGQPYQLVQDETHLYFVSGRVTGPDEVSDGRLERLRFEDEQVELLSEAWRLPTAVALDDTHLYVAADQHIWRLPKP